MPRKLNSLGEPRLPARRSSLHRRPVKDVADINEFSKVRDSQSASTWNTRTSGESSRQSSSDKSRSVYSDIDSADNNQLVSQKGGKELVDDDETVYVFKKDIVARLVPMDVETELVPFDEVPEEAKRQPTTILTWARQTPEFLHLETIVPPQCRVCLEELEARLLVGNSKAIQGEEEEEESFFDADDDGAIMEKDLIPRLENLLISTPGLDVPGTYPWGTTMT